MNGVIMKEYPDDDVEVNEGELGQFQAKRTVSKYIESISDEVFAIYVSISLCPLSTRHKKMRYLYCRLHRKSQIIHSGIVAKRSSFTGIEKMLI